ncbi:phosphoadenylyl-sulfate reductase (thioredoxin) [Marinicauda pacifica]|uniref:Adenosine 5'-phosphosulfate reductase n=1 Tax=Marinicauda pacifica TaxID=1133559 RepID=A0A4V3RYX2_9PROT|nr:phosphoadenylyl-sulfate reductase [Marinicauda pacifica]TGY92079.1 phosphoadenylyl-sulfate reductase [Marinicauda pacifica]GGE45800.1 phosphoadenylyl-sulfate reductase (thioredoxin) [Marinicauda pacifica]
MASLKSEYRLALEAGAQALEAALSGLDAQGALKRCLAEIFKGESCVVSSFGTESAVILHMAAQIAPDTPVLFVDTGQLFDETLAYRDSLAERFGLTNVRSLTPSPHDIAADDPDGTLHKTNPDLCCHVRKTLPLIRALQPYKVWVSGRKRYHGGERADIPRVEIQDGKLKLNPLYDWDAEALRAYSREHDLPQHPLLKQKYLSVGCVPCTSPVAPDDDPRAGRWAGQDKTECGIHIGADGTITRTTG